MSETIYRKLKELKKLPNNPRVIFDDDFKRLCDSVQNNADYFKARPLILSDRTGELIIIAGNQRYEAAKRLKFQEVPTHLIENLTEEREKEIIIRDNVANGQWDFELLDSGAWDLQDLNDWGVVMPDFEAIEETGEPQDAEAQIDKAELLNEKWQVKKGDLFSIGSHRLLCGDSTKREDVSRLLEGQKAEMMFTDPPYGVDYTGGIQFNGDGTATTNNREKLAADDTTAIYFDFLPVVLPFVDGACYMWFIGSKGKDVYNAVDLSKGEIHALIIWNKINATYAAMFAHYKSRHESCLYFKPKGSTLRWCGATTEATLWEIAKDGKNTFHPTQKPIELAMKAIGNHTAQTVLDVFGGSGSTMVAAENKNRKAYLCEISENYCAVILQRMTDAFPDLEIKRISQGEAANG